ncbi:MAG: SRPBCC family protein [Actinobacteria bacterium]|nr:SRPBCC family protein [Actinomycetota bacterium]
MRLVHRVPTSAAPAQVWELLGDASAWPSWDLALRGVRGKARPGAHLMALLRFPVVGIPVDVVVLEPERRLVLLVHLAPGLRQEVSYELTPSVSGGTDITVSVVVDGLLARPAALPLWFWEGFTARVLAARTERFSRRVAA